MGILTGPEIRTCLADGRLVIDPAPRTVNPNSANLTLAPTLVVYKKMLWLHELWEKNFPHVPDLTGERYEPLDMAADEETAELPLPDDGRVLFPGMLYLGTTAEYTETPTLVPNIEGRSSVGRLGLFQHVTAGFGDVGFKGQWTLELVTVYPLVVYPRVEVCQISYATSTGTIEPYAGQYSRQTGPRKSGLFRELAGRARRILRG